MPERTVRQPTVRAARRSKWKMQKLLIAERAHAQTQRARLRVSVEVITQYSCGSTRFPQQGKGTTLTTLTRDDFYDYLRCPKIVSIKAYHRLRRAPRKLQPHVSTTAPSPQEIGALGEAGLQVAFSEEPKTESFETLTPKQFLTILRANVGHNLKESSKEIVAEMFEGLKTVRREINDAFGSVTIIGRGSCRMGFLPNQGLPDFVAVTKGRRYVFIEGKNTLDPTPKDSFQARWYNTMSTRGTAMVLEERNERGTQVLKPLVAFEVAVDTLLVYPRLGECEKVTGTLPISRKTTKEVWAAKQLGFQRMWPETDCEAKCPHERYDIELQEGSMDAAPPLPIIFAEGLVEEGFDLDFEYARKYLWRLVDRDTAMPHSLKVLGKRDRMAYEKSITEDIANVAGFSRRDIARFLKREYTIGPTNDELMKAMDSEVEPWRKILGRKKLKRVGAHVLAVAKGVYPLPKKSIPFASKACREWDL